ncbi:MAG: carbohydrate kinase, partial [Calditrichaeota bacterium]|nr:carbohydrate kinase [Calditrichota bacterium]
LIACVGNENLGKYLVQSVKKTGVICDYIAVEPVAPTTIVLVSRTTGTPDFIAYRTADRMILPSHIPNNVLQKTQFYHTTCFALSQEPAQSSIVDGARRAAQLDCKLSIDVNYAPSIWGDRDEARRVIAEYCSHGAFVKMSLDDIVRLFDDPALDEQTAIATFHDWGAELICLTKGAAGSLVSWEFGQKMQHQSARKISECADATGAGDAFWSGFLTAWLDGYEPPECAVAGSNIAAMKLAVVGPLPEAVPREKIYEIFD